MPLSIPDSKALLPGLGYVVFLRLSAWNFYRSPVAAALPKIADRNPLVEVVLSGTAS